MEKRHQVTKLEKYEENKKNCNVRQYVSVSSLAIGILVTSLNLPAESVKDYIISILGSITISLSTSNLIEAIVEKYNLQQKIDELKDQEENQSRSR